MTAKRILATLAVLGASATITGGEIPAAQADEVQKADPAAAKPAKAAAAKPTKTAAAKPTKTAAAKSTKANTSPELPPVAPKSVPEVPVGVDTSSGDGGCGAG